MKDTPTSEFNIFIGSRLLTTDTNIPSDCYKDTDFIAYKIYLPEFQHLTNDLKVFLDIQEQGRAAKYHKETDKNRFIICRSLLKFALARHTQSDINDIFIKLLNNKKPYLPKHPNVFFNVSHSGDYAVLAISTSPIGIDIEHINLNYAFQETLPYVFNEDEIQFINNAEHKARAFYSLWTRKEAFVKALGKGIDDDFSKIPCLDGLHHLDAALIESSQHWQVHNFKIDNNDNYLGAIANPTNNMCGGEKFHFHTLPHAIEDIIKMRF